MKNVPVIRILVLVSVFAATHATATTIPVGDQPDSTSVWMDRSDFRWCPDPPDGGALPGDASGGPTYESYGIGARLIGSLLVVIVETNFPPGGSGIGTDSYGADWFHPGDLYINVGGTFQDDTGTVYGIATTNHANVLDPSNPDSGAWNAVSKGSLYGLATGMDAIGGANQELFATGTWESYGAGTPGDGGNDPYGRANNYPTLIRNGIEVTNTSTVAVAYSGGPAPRYQYQYTVDIGYLGIVPNDTQFQLFWAMECGNDGIEWKGDIPEPMTFLLIGSGFVALAYRGKNSFHM